jgi:tetratricopeptide (TPR) repeat protein
MHPLLANVLRDLGGMYQRFGDLEKARTCCERALHIDEACFGPDHGNVSIDLNNLGRVLHEQGALEQARTHFERAIAIQERTEHHELAKTLDNLGRVQEEQGDLPRARASFMRSLALPERLHDPDHPDVANVLNNLGAFFLRIGEPSQARDYLERALAIDERAYGHSHPEVATDLGNLASVLVLLGEKERSVEMFRRALSIHEANQAAPLNEVLSCLTMLGRLHYERHEWESARGFLEQALRLQEQGKPDDSQLFDLLVLLGSALRHKGEHAWAVVHLERARTLPVKAPDDQSLGTLLINLGAAHRELGHGEQARAILEEARQLAEKGGKKANLVPIYLEQGRLARDNGELEVAGSVLEQAWRLGEEVELERPDLLLNEWGLVLEEQHELAKARPLFERALKLSETIHGPDSYTVAVIAGNLGRVLCYLGELPAARQHLERALALHERFNQIAQELPEEVLPHAFALRGELFLELERWQDARASMEQALRQPTSSSLPPKRLSDLHNNLGIAYQERGNLKLALLHMDKAVSLAAKAHGTNHPEYALALRNLGVCLERAGKPQQALKKYKRALAILPPEHPLAREIQRWLERLPR